MMNEQIAASQIQPYLIAGMDYVSAARKLIALYRGFIANAASGEYPDWIVTQWHLALAWWEDVG
jgi:hypothetical protein